MRDEVQQKSMNGFKGLDLRKLPTASPLNTLRKALNVDLTVSGGVENRDPIVPFATVHPNSVGLYALGGHLRCAIAGGHSIVPPPGVVYDRIGHGGSAYPLNSITALSGWETIGTSTLTGLMPYLVIRRADGSYEHHWIQKPSYPDSVVPDTYVTLPYKPGPFLIKMVEKLWAIDTYNNAVPYSSVTNGPTDWTLANDAGELPTQDQISGDRHITGLANIEGQLVVFFEDCIQSWNVFADPLNPGFGLQKVVNGPGTTAPYSIDNVRGDLYYFSQGAFRRLQKNLLTGQFREGDLGKEIWPLTRTLDIKSPGQAPFGRWFQSRQQYICFIGSFAYCYLDCTLDGQTNAGWTMWQLPAPVVAAVELDGSLYVRCGNVIYKMINEGDPALLEPGFRFDVRTQLYDGGDHHVSKDWKFFENEMAGDADLSCYDDPTHVDTPTGDPIPLTGLTADGRSWTPLCLNSAHLGLGLQGSGLFQLEELTLYYNQLEF